MAMDRAIRKSTAPGTSCYGIVMTHVTKFGAMPLILMALTACVGQNNRVDTIAEIEATTNTVLQGRWITGPGGVQVRP